MRRPSAMNIRDQRRFLRVMFRPGNRRPKASQYVRGLSRLMQCAQGVSSEFQKMQTSIESFESIVSRWFPGFTVPNRRQRPASIPSLVIGCPPMNVAAGGESSPTVGPFGNSDPM